MREPEGPAVVVCSRGRPDGAVFRLLRDAGMPWVVIVEPQEEAEYQNCGHGDVVVLPEGGQGLAYTRNAALALARKRGLPWWWMLDDDVTGFYVQHGQRAVSCPPLDAFRTTEAAMRAVGATVAGMQYQQYVWSATRRAAVNRWCDVVTLYATPLLEGLRFRPETGTKCDRDMVLQAIAAGQRTVCLQRYGFACPKNGSNPGGLHEVYAATGVEREDCRRMVGLWGRDVCQVVRKPDGRVDVRVRWKAMGA